MDSEEVPPPPPYSAVDPMIPQANNRNAAASAEVNRTLLRLRGGDAASYSPPASPTTSVAGSESTSASAAVPAHFASAAAYFAERAPPAQNPERSIVEHCVTIYPRSQSKDFPRRPRCWNTRTEDITQQDWDMFLRCLFPPHLGLASSSSELPRQLRAEIQRDRKDRPQESDADRKRRIAAVIMEWNQYFFEPRSARVMYNYVIDPQRAPRSSLCPRCYPAATSRTGQASSNAARILQQEPSPSPAAPGPVAAATPNATPSPAPYGYPPFPPPPPPGPYGAPYGPPAFYTAPAVPPVPPVQPPVYPYASPPPPPPGQYPLPNTWGWNAPPYGYACQNQSQLKGGPLGWIASLASQAQRYGERITEQAAQYGDHISAQAQHYGRQVEEQALAHSRWLEEQAGLSGRKMEGAFTGFVGRPQNEWGAAEPPKIGYYNAPYTQSVAAPTEVTSGITTNQQPGSTPSERTRRASVSSEASDTSFSSIDTFSTTSELSASDLATVRAQLLSLNDYHDRALYEQAVGLRRQLDLLQESRRQTRLSGRRDWRHGWGRWESPQQQQRKQAEKRAVKEETRATRKAFRDVVRRAREEQREQRRVRRNRRRQEQRALQSSETAADPALEQHIQNLSLENSCEAQQTTPSSASLSPPVRFELEANEISPVNTPNTKSTGKEEKEEEKEAVQKGNAEGGVVSVDKGVDKAAHETNAEHAKRDLTGRK
ncbi:uncharacterized protein BP01DRAFT_355807 [Aspergillus saccharolyticus JOP 1030-1]|uniref:Uncharacterized protein n=1 Tax=Aspergillus saccharolyticus JOP 1030-1 TaxID=1450539 RepID=A0A318ZFG3_9EURO|nr:hypothetical protein BP01DRAFT_355807 [Aspergillus saccharolyticus JOP 1030-1]PYH46159.1 hypothetical protein BP01DRAFT_355807 [Aspergillus saccharolyticus JOP 1030-1]